MYLCVHLLQAISKARCLEKLSIYNNSIGARGCQALTAAVAATPGLKVISCAASADCAMTCQLLCICMHTLHTPSLTFNSQRQNLRKCSAARVAADGIMYMAKHGWGR